MGVQQQSHYLRRQLHLLPVQVAGTCRSENWDLYLYGVFTFMVDRDSVEVLPWGVPPAWFSPYLATDHTIFELCRLLSVAWV